MAVTVPMHCFTRRLCGQLVSAFHNHAVFPKRWFSSGSPSAYPAENSLSEKLKEKFIIEPFTAKFRNDAMRLLLTSFERDEPITSSMERLPTESEAAPIFEHLFIKPALEANVSFVAIDKATDRVIAVYISSIHRRANATEDTYEVSDTSNPMIIVMDFLDIVGSGIWDILPADVHTIVKNDIASVLEEYRCYKLAGFMKDMSIQAAKKQGCQYAVAIPTSKYSQQMNERLNFELLRFINYSDYRVLGKRPFRNMKPPHVRAQLMAKRLI